MLTKSTCLIIYYIMKKVKIGITSTSKEIEIPSINQLDFLDIGGSKGDSFKLHQTQYGRNGLSIDINPEKVATSIKNFAPSIQLDACYMRIFNDNAAKTVTMSHFLEHLPSVDIIDDILKESIRIASHTIHIRGPMFYE